MNYFKRGIIRLKAYERKNLHH